MTAIRHSAFNAALSAFVLATAATPNAGAQDADTARWVEPWGSSSRAAAEPYQRAGRDPSGNRLIYNGRAIDLGAQSGPSSRAARYSAGAGATGTSTLSRGTVTAAAIGNSVDIRGVRNATIVIRQHNNGGQRATVRRGG